MGALYHARGKWLAVADRSVFKRAPFFPQLVRKGNRKFTLRAATRHPAPLQCFNIYPWGP